MREPVIDLDVTREPAETESTGRRLRSVKAVALVPAGVIVGAAGMYLWVATEQRRRDASEVSLFLEVAGLSSAGGESGYVIVSGSVAVINGGPMPVDVSSPAGTETLVLNGEQRIEPDRAGMYAVTAFVPCGEDAGARPMPVALLVVTSDGRRRMVTTLLHLMGSRWYEAVMRACERQG